MKEREWRPDNDYKVDRDLQKDKLYTGITNFVSQDMMVTESMGCDLGPLAGAPRHHRQVDHQAALSS